MAIWFIPFTVCCNITIILKCRMNDPSLKRIHWFKRNRALGALYLVRNILCKILKCLFSSLSVIFRINLNLIIFIGMFVDCKICQILKGIKCLPSLTDQNSHIISL